MKKVKIKKFQMLLVSKIDKELKVDRAEFIWALIEQEFPYNRVSINAICVKAQFKAFQDWIELKLSPH